MIDLWRNGAVGGAGGHKSTYGIRSCPRLQMKGPVAVVTHLLCLNVGV